LLVAAVVLPILMIREVVLNSDNVVCWLCYCYCDENL
jgi:hypothetical protein